MSKIILVVVLLNTLVAFAGLFYSYTQNNSAVSETSQEQAAVESSEAPRKVLKAEDLTFYPVEKIIVTVSGENREHYFVFDLALFADSKVDPKTLEKIEPLVRNSVVTALSLRNFRNLRAAPIPQLQADLEEVLKRDFAQLGVERPFRHVLISKLVIQ